MEDGWLPEAKWASVAGGRALKVVQLCQERPVRRLIGAGDSRPFLQMVHAIRLT